MRKRSFKALSLALLSACMLAGASITAGAVPENLFSCSTSRDAENDILVDFKEVQITLPSSWAGKRQVSTAADSASFFHIQSRKLWTASLGYENGGFLFSINFSENMDFTDLPSYQLIGETAAGYYYVCFATDMQGYTDDADALNEFRTLSDGVNQVVSTIRIKDEYKKSTGNNISIGSASDYIFPDSSEVVISTSDLTSLSGNQIQMAINEIYARHHRKFVLQEVQDYFNGKSWYSVTIEAADFDPTVLNQCENENIALMVKYMKDNGITYSFSGTQSSTSGNSSSTVTTSETIGVYGTVITKASTYFRLQQPDGNVIQFWFDPAKLAAMGDTAETLQPGVTASVTYDTESYEAVDVTVW